MDDVREEYMIIPGHFLNLTSLRTLFRMHIDTCRVLFQQRLAPDISTFLPTVFLCRRSKGDGSGFERLLVDSLGRECHIASMDYLNEISCSEQNLLSSSIVIDDKSGTVAEASSYLNVIHLYSLDASRKGFAKTVALGNRLVGIRDVERQGLDLIPRTYYDVHPYKGFFAALYVGAKMEDFEQGICPHPAIHLFSWTGEPLAKIHLPVNALLFDIDALMSR